MSTKNKGVLRTAAALALVAMAGFVTAALAPAISAQEQAPKPTDAQHEGHDHPATAAQEITNAVAVLSPASGSKVSGTVTCPCP